MPWLDSFTISDSGVPSGDGIALGRWTATSLRSQFQMSAQAKRFAAANRELRHVRLFVRETNSDICRAITPGPRRVNAREDQRDR